MSPKRFRKKLTWEVNGGPERPQYQQLLENEKLQLALREADSSGTVKVFSQDPEFRVLGMTKIEGYKTVGVRAIWHLKPWRLHELGLLLRRTGVWFLDAFSRKTPRDLNDTETRWLIPTRSESKLWEIHSLSLYANNPSFVEKYYIQIVGKQYTFWVEKHDPTQIIWDDKAFPFDRKDGWSMGAVCRILMAWTEELLGEAVPFVVYLD